MFARSTNSLFNLLGGNEKYNAIMMRVSVEVEDKHRSKATERGWLRLGMHAGYGVGKVR